MDDDAPREKTFLLARHETRVLDWLARRLPARVMPDHMTILGVVAALGIGAAYWLTLLDPAWLWVASGLLVVHWLGDSLDGTLARVRRIERPVRLYLDHLVDAGATIVIGVGLGLSPYMSLVTGLAIVIAYLALSINTYLETQVFGVFSLGYARVGPTEARVGLIALNLALLAGATFQVAGQGLIDIVGLGGAALMITALGVRAARNLRVLAAREPAGVVSGDQAISAVTVNTARPRMWLKRLYPRNAGVARPGRRGSRRPARGPRSSSGAGRAQAAGLRRRSASSRVVRS